MNKKYKVLFCLVFISSLSYTQSELHLTSGSSITTSGASTITLNNVRLVNNGTITDSNGTLQIRGAQTTANTTISGTGTNTFNNFVINKSSNGVQLNSNIAVTANLNLLSGGLVLNSGSVNLGTTGVLQNETETNTITGTGGNIVAIGTLNAPTNSNPGNLGAIISSSANLGATTVTRAHNPITNNTPGINRNYTITPTNNTGLNATLRFNYLDSELNGNTEANLRIWESLDNGITWAQTSSTINPTANYLDLTNINAFGKYTANNMDAVLSIDTFDIANNLSVYKTAGGIQINAPLDIKDINIYNLLGQLMYTTNKVGKQSLQIPLNTQKEEVLIVRVVFENGKKIIKKIIY